jgi:hypothetical protein
LNGRRREMAAAKRNAAGNVARSYVRDLLRFREIFAKRHRRFELTIGPPILPNEITGSRHDAIRFLQTYVESGLRRGVVFAAAKS